MDRTCIYVLLIVLAQNRIVKSKENLIMRIKKLQQCEEHRDTPIIVEEIILNAVGIDQYAISGTTRVKEDTPGPLQFLADIGKCSEKQSIDKCEHFLTPVVGDLCKDLKDEESRTYKFLKLWGLKPSCPIRAGNYTFTPNDFNVDFLRSMARLFGKYWNTRIIFADPKGNIKFCIYAQVEMVKRAEIQKNHNFKG